MEQFSRREEWKHDRIIDSFEVTPEQVNQPGYLDSLIKNIMSIDQTVFLPSLLYTKEDWKHLLTKERTVLKLVEEILESGEKKLVGYALSYPATKDTIHELSENGDSELEHDTKNYNPETSAYLESVALGKEYNHSGSFPSLFQEHLDTLRAKGFKKVLIHAKPDTLAPILREHYQLEPKRVIENWMGNQGFEFFEIDL